MTIKTKILIIVLLVFVFGCTKEPQKVQVTSLEITNIYRNCDKYDPNPTEYVDTTIQTSVRINVDNSDNKVLKIGFSPYDCQLKIGTNEIFGYSITNVNTGDGGINQTGLYTITGGELTGDRSAILTFCCQDYCDQRNIELCEN